LHSSVAIALFGALAAFAFVPQHAAQAQHAANVAAPFNAWRAAWVRHADQGSLAGDFQVIELKTYAPGGPQVVVPKPGDLFVYVNTGGQDACGLARPDVFNLNAHSRVSVFNARTRELVGSQEMHDASGVLHASAVSPDGRFAYVPSDNGSSPVLFKVDALTLQPLKMLDVGGAIHHMQVWQDRYLLIDVYSPQESGSGEKHATFLLDPETDTVVGGIRAQGMGGYPYSAWADPAHEFIYFLMEPASDAVTSPEFQAGAIVGAVPFWVAKVDPKDWSVVAEYPYPGLRSNWIQFDANGSHMFVNGSADDSLSKIDIATGEMVWRAFTGAGPDGIELSADGTEVWIANRGANWKYHSGKTMTVVNAETGARIETVITEGSGINHIVLSPDGTEIWASAGDSGALIVVDALTRKNLARLPMPGFGDPHGVVFVAYDAEGNGRVVADQGDFHGGIDPRNGAPLR
jgi:DNA-binding beta-propeller fold protein YncE